MVYNINCRYKMIIPFRWSDIVILKFLGFISSLGIKGEKIETVTEDHLDS